MTRDRDRSSRSESNDEDHLRVLAICYYVFGGLATLCSLFPGIYLAIGIMFLTGAMKPPPPPNVNGPQAPNAPPFVVNGPQGNVPAPNNAPVNPNGFPVNPNQAQVNDQAFEMMGWIMTIGSGVAILLGWAYAGCMIVAGSMLHRKRRRLFCLVMGGFACLQQPIGVVLGVFTFIVLLRPSVKELFEENAGQHLAEGPDSYGPNPGLEG